MKENTISRIIYITTVSAMGLLCVILFTISTNQQNKIERMEEQQIEYKMKTEERFEILIDEIDYLEKKLEKKNEIEIKDALKYIEPLKENNKEQYTVEYKNILNIYDKDIELYNEYTEEEIYTICRCIETETYQCPFEAKVNVANVIFNRIENDLFPNDAISVITAANQFAYHRTNISEDTVLALEYAYLNEDTTNGAIAFRSDSTQQHWGSLELCHNDGFHCFYK